MAQLRMPGGVGTVHIPDDLVDKYRADGWTPVVAPEPIAPEPEHKTRPTRKTPNRA